jgi:methionyl-tRNA synthetase
MGLGRDFKSDLATLDNNALKNTGGNFVYIVGSDAFFASEMLAELQEELEIFKEFRWRLESMSFELEAYLFKESDKKSFNIVSDLNNYLSAKKKGEKWKSDLSSHTLRLRSSFGFSI